MNLLAEYDEECSEIIWLGFLQATKLQIWGNYKSFFLTEWVMKPGLFFAGPLITV